MEGDEEVAEIVLHGDAGATLTHLVGDLERRAEKEAARRYEDIFAGLPEVESKSRSVAERRRRGLDGQTNYVYGEVEFESWVRILRGLRPRRGARLLDLGSGVGKPVIAAALVCDFAELVGIEYLEDLTSAAVEAELRFEVVQQQAGMLPCDLPEITFHHGSFLDYDWSRFDIILANSTCFSTELMADIARRARNTREGTIFVSLSAPISAPYMKLLSSQTYRMSWGEATVHIQRRIPEAAASSPPPPLAPSGTAAYTPPPRITTPTSHRSEGSPAGRSAGSPDRRAAPGMPPHPWDRWDGSHMTPGDEHRPRVDVGDGLEGLSGGGFVESAGLAAEESPPEKPGAGASVAEEENGVGLDGLSSPQGVALLRAKRRPRLPQPMEESGSDTDGAPAHIPWGGTPPPRHPSAEDMAGPAAAQAAPGALQAAMHDKGPATLARRLQREWAEDDPADGSSSPQGDALLHAKAARARRQRM